MLRYVDSTKMGRGNHGWLDSHFHFSFADYYNPNNIRFGVLRVVNDDQVEPAGGFPTHPHRDMEIISYVIDGELSHKDSMGNVGTLTRGEVQYMSAGTGVTHSEFNNGKEMLRFNQIWIFPDKQNHTPNYGDFHFKWEDRVGKWLPLVTCADKPGNEAPIKIHQDVNVYATWIETGSELEFRVAQDRQAYMILEEGEATINGINLKMRDALEIIKEDVVIKAKKDAHLLVLEMAFDQEWFDEHYGRFEAQYQGE